MVLPSSSFPSPWSDASPFFFYPNITIGTQSRLNRGGRRRRTPTIHTWAQVKIIHFPPCLANFWTFCLISF